jgi:gluconolactonase
MNKLLLYISTVFLSYNISCFNTLRDNRVADGREIASLGNGTPERHVHNDTIFYPTQLVSASQHGVLDTIQKGFAFTEGPAVDKDGNVFFKDQPNDKIYKWKGAAGQISTFLAITGRCNGWAFDAQGNLKVCTNLRSDFVFKILHAL